MKIIPSLIRPFGAATLIAAIVGMPALASGARAAEVRHPVGTTAGVPCIPAGHGSGDVPSIAFGRTAGNIRPLQVSIYGDGTITYKGVTPGVPNYAIAPLAVLGLERLANAEGFWKLPATIGGSHVLPDIASQYISVRAGCTTTVKTVVARGANLGGFSELYSTLLAATSLAVLVTTATPTPLPAATNGPATITLANDGQTLRYAIGTGFQVMLDRGYRWQVSLAPSGVFQTGSAASSTDQGSYTARASGTAALTAEGSQICPIGKACTEVVREFTVTLVAQ